MRITVGDKVYEVDPAALVKTLTAHAATVGVVAGIFWGIARPHAEEFVRVEVAQNVESRFKALEDSVKELKARQDEQTIQRAVNQAKTEADLANIKNSQATTERDIKNILGGLRNNGLVEPESTSSNQH